ncbi:MAG: Na/Pi cotransporter family protein [Eubacteriales bacterium]|nr:Na/Pi cotransporter family protein [Christensenellaceae bacterium]MDY3241977.1 Na/Pi cotransporter family protein [Eubacteriales bacterium]
MNWLDILYAFLSLLGGIGVFLYGMKLMGDSLEMVAGNEIKRMFAKISDNKIIGVGIGAVTTAVVQSSAAVTVMAIGFVNSGLMSLIQAAAIVFGANIGTTSTALIVALGVGGLADVKLTVIFAALAGVGAMTIMFSKKDKIKKIGGIITGLGMIFVGLSVMTDSMTIFSESPKIVEFLAKISNPALLLLFGIAFTALIQSSSAVSGIVVTMSVAGLLSFDQGLYIILGSNIGTCITSLIASIGTNTNAKRTAVIHLMFNVIGVLIFGLVSISGVFSKMFMPINNPAMRIALLHTFFNVVTTVILLPFMNLLVKLVSKMVPEKHKDEKTDEPHLYYLEERLLRTPPVAVAQMKNEVINMAEIAKNNFDVCVDAVMRAKVSDVIEDVQRNENTLNFLNREMAKYLVKLSQVDLSEEDKQLIGTTYHTISDIERIGDYAENISEYAEKLENDGVAFSEGAIKEIGTLKDTINNLYNFVMKTYKEATIDYIADVNYYEESVDKLKEDMSEHHIERMNNGTCTPEVGALYLSLASNAERVADHMTNIAFAVKSYAKKNEKKEKEVKEAK